MVEPAQHDGSGGVPVDDRGDPGWDTHRLVTREPVAKERVMLHGAPHALGQMVAKQMAA